METVREVHLFDYVDFQSYKDIMKILLTKTNSYSKIIMYMNSYGGDVEIGLSLLKTLKLLKKEIITINMGYCCSMAHILYLAGDVRLTLPFSNFMIHGSSYWQETPKAIEDVKIDVTKTMKQDKYLNDYIIKRSKMKKKDLDDILSARKDFYYGSEEAIKNGTSHRIIKSLSPRTILS